MNGIKSICLREYSLSDRAGLLAGQRGKGDVERWNMQTVKAVLRLVFFFFNPFQL